MKEPVIKESFIAKNVYTNTIFIWVSTPDGHNWVNTNCSKFGELYISHDEKNKYILIVTQLCEFEDVYEYLCQELGYVK